MLANLTIDGFQQMYALEKTWSIGARFQQGFDEPYEVIQAAKMSGTANPLPLGYAHVLIDPGFTSILHFLDFCKILPKQ